MASIQSQHGLRSQNANRMLTLFRKICFDGKNSQSLVPTVKTPETPVKSRVSGVLKGAGKRSKCSKRHPLPRTRNQFAGNRTRVRIPPAEPSRSKRYIACSDLFYKSARAHSAAPPFQIEPATLGFDLVLGADLGANATFSAITDKGCCEIAQQPPFYDTELAYFDSYAGRSILLSGDHFRAEKTLAF